MYISAYHFTFVTGYSSSEFCAISNILGKKSSLVIWQSQHFDVLRVILVWIALSSLSFHLLPRTYTNRMTGLGSYNPNPLVNCPRSFLKCQLSIYTFRHTHIHPSRHIIHKGSKQILSPSSRKPIGTSDCRVCWKAPWTVRPMTPCTDV